MIATERLAVEPLSQAGRVPCSVPLTDADLAAGNSNWTKGLQAMSEWIWSANLNPAAFPNNLGKLLLQIPGVFEQQLNYSTSLIFDEPSFRNGVQVSGMLPRVTREQVISLIAQRRHCWYSMTHHAILGKLTANKHGMPEAEFIARWKNLTEHRSHPEVYTPGERAALAFADAFATDPKSYSDEQYRELRAAFAAENRRRYADEACRPEVLEAARRARAWGLLEGFADADLDRISSQEAQKAARAPMPEGINERLVDAQVVELAFLCLQFVALTGVFSGLNVPDEDFLPDTLKAVVPAEVIARINELNAAGGDGLPELIPPRVELPLRDILAGKVSVELAPLKGARIPLVPYEIEPSQGTRDKGVALGGVQTGVYGWAFGRHLPGSLPYVLMHHPELARFEPPYSLPLLFNEDEWRNGVQTSGFASRRLKEMAIQKVYRLLRTRYGMEHHLMYFFATYLQEHGGGDFRLPSFSDDQARRATALALERANRAASYIQEHRKAPAGAYTPLELALLDWTEALVTRPHQAYVLEPDLRRALDADNRREVAAGLRRLDSSLDPGKPDAAYRRLLDHQIAELAMTVCHMDGLGRALTILRVEAEEPVEAFRTNERGEIVPTGYYQSRPGWHQIVNGLGASDAVLTLTELLLNPDLNRRVKDRLAAGETVRVSGREAANTAEF
ncbi:MAG TPA: hypothetical protein VF789_18170 [Thermoanaerobaculia bacterium]